MCHSDWEAGIHAPGMAMQERRLRSYTLQDEEHKRELLSVLDAG
jgi:hypothetical protein